MKFLILCLFLLIGCSDNDRPLGANEVRVGTAFVSHTTFEYITVNAHTYLVVGSGRTQMMAHNPDCKKCNTKPTKGDTEK